jgi:MSHA pilin protein MshA
MKNQQGFTLIELIIVIVILGLLAVTAAPKFIGMQSDARKATVQGLAGTLKSAGNIVYAKSALDGVESAATGTANGVSVVYGYPAATKDALQAAADIPDSDWTFVEGSGAAAVAANPASKTVGLHPVGATVDFTVTVATGASCHAVYTPPSAPGGSPSIAVVTGGC